MDLDSSLFVHAVTVFALSIILVFSLYQRSRAKAAQRAWEASVSDDSSVGKLNDTAPDGPRV